MYRRIFKAESKEDLLVKLPEEYLNKQVEVIAFQIEKEDEIVWAAKKEAAKKATDFFRTININTAGYIFNREEANER